MLEPISLMVLVLSGVCSNNDRAASILLYHVITGVGALDTTKVPNGFNGQSLTTMLPGHNLTLSIAANLMKMIYAEVLYVFAIDFGHEKCPYL
jgi:hypothetical protein